MCVDIYPNSYLEMTVTPNIPMMSPVEITFSLRGEIVWGGKCARTINSALTRYENHSRHSRIPVRDPSIRLYGDRTSCNGFDQSQPTCAEGMPMGPSRVLALILSARVAKS